MRTAESVTPMHPDKICDRISDAILDACLTQDPKSRVAIETMGGHGIITVTGEMTTNAFVDIRDIVKGIVGDKYGTQVNIVRQSSDIANGVDRGGAGDQGIMVGYATSETREMIPREVKMSRNLCRYIYEQFPTDGKTQVTLGDHNELVSVVASFQNTTSKEIEDLVRGYFGGDGYNVYANPAGDWSCGGFDADTGLTGRKLAVDNYGPRVPIGGGAFSGKDPSKVDRSGAYMARKIAVDILKEKCANEVYVWLAYAIGHDQPVEATAIIDGQIEQIKGYDLSPRGMIEQLDLLKPIYAKTAEWGHFGRNNTWDK